MGRLEAASINMADIKIGAQTFPLNALAQVSPKGANTCAVSPFDSSQVEMI